MLVLSKLYIFIYNAYEFTAFATSAKHLPDMNFQAPATMGFSCYHVYFSSFGPRNIFPTHPYLSQKLKRTNKIMQIYPSKCSRNFHSHLKIISFPFVVSCVGVWFQLKSYQLWLGLCTLRMEARQKLNLYVIS